MGGRSIVRDVLFKRRDATKERITWQLESERKGIFTLSEGDLYSYKAKFVSACKQLSLSPTSQPSVNVDDLAVGIMGTVRGYFYGRRDCLRFGLLIDPLPSVSQTLP